MFKKLFLPALIALISITVFNSCNNPVSLDIFPGLEAILNRFFLNE